MSRVTVDPPFALRTSTFVLPLVTPAVDYYACAYGF